MEFFLCVIGMVLVVEGLPYCTFPERMKELMALMHEQPDTTLRIMGGVLTVLGVALVYLARRALIPG